MQNKNFINLTNATPILLFFTIVVLCVAFFGSNTLLSNANSPPSNKDAVIGLLSLIAAISSLWNTFSSYQNATRIEELKQQLSVQLPALKESRAAALRYYRTLSRLENQKCTHEDYQKSEDLMLSAEGSIYFLSEDYQKDWHSYWQAARNIYTKIQNKSQDEAVDYWKNKGAKDLAYKFQKIQQY